MARLDAWARRGLPGTEAVGRRWYGDEPAVRLSGFLGLGTEILLLTVCSVSGRLDAYFAVNLVGMNLLWLVCVVYRRVTVRARLSRDA
jgi:hypothetical protein